MKNTITTLVIFYNFKRFRKDVFSADTWTFTESPIKTTTHINTETECKCRAK